MGMFSEQDYKRAFGSQYRPGKVTGLDEMVKRGTLSQMDKERIKDLMPEKPSLGRTIRKIISKNAVAKTDAAKAETLSRLIKSRE